MFRHHGDEGGGVRSWTLTPLHSLDRLQSRQARNLQIDGCDTCRWEDGVRFSEVLTSLDRWRVQAAQHVTVSISGTSIKIAQQVCSTSALLLVTKPLIYLCAGLTKECCMRSRRR
jgi:hypothetical protein